MSHNHVDWARKRAPVTSVATRSVLRELAELAGPNGEHIYPSQKALAKWCCCTERTVERAIRELKTLKKDQGDDEWVPCDLSECEPYKRCATKGCDPDTCICTFRWCDHSLCGHSSHALLKVVVQGGRGLRPTGRARKVSNYRLRSFDRPPEPLPVTAPAVAAPVAEVGPDSSPDPDMTSVSAESDPRHDVGVGHRHEVGPNYHYRQGGESPPAPDAAKKSVQPPIGDEIQESLDGVPRRPEAAQEPVDQADGLAPPGLAASEESVQPPSRDDLLAAEQERRQDQLVAEMLDANDESVAVTNSAAPGGDGSPQNDLRCPGSGTHRQQAAPVRPGQIVDPHAATVKRAQSYLDAHANDDLDLAEGEFLLLMDILNGAFEGRAEATQRLRWLDTIRADREDPMPPEVGSRTPPVLVDDDEDLAYLDTALDYLAAHHDSALELQPEEISFLSEVIHGYNDLTTAHELVQQFLHARKSRSAPTLEDICWQESPPQADVVPDRAPDGTGTGVEVASVPQPAPDQAESRVVNLDHLAVNDEFPF